MSQLTADCLNEIFECLENDKLTLHSCLLVNRLWCQVSVRILWRIVWNYSTLIACLPIESKEILYKNDITILTSTLEPPAFNYAAFCKFLSIRQVYYCVELLLKNQQSKSISSKILNNNIYIASQEIYKLFMSRISSLKRIDYYLPYPNNINNIPFTSYPGAKNCLKDLSELRCCSDIYPEFFYQLSKISHNIQTLSMIFEEVISNGLTDLITAQQNLKYLTIMQYYNCENFKGVIPSLMKIPNTLIKLELDVYYTPFSVIAKFTNLQELILSFDPFDQNNNDFKDFSKILNVTFSQLQILKFPYNCPKYELLINFLEINGKSLKEFDISVNNNTLNLAIAKFCPNLKLVSTKILECELDTLKEIFIKCQYLESIKIWCCDEYLNEKELLEVVSEYSPKNFYKLELCYIIGKSELRPEELESFLISWMNRTPQKSLSLIIARYFKNSLDKNKENMKIIEKYIKLGVMKFESHW